MGEQLPDEVPAARVLRRINNDHADALANRLGECLVVFGVSLLVLSGAAIARRRSTASRRAPSRLAASASTVPRKTVGRFTVSERLRKNKVTFVARVKYNGG